VRVVIERAFKFPGVSLTRILGQTPQHCPPDRAAWQGFDHGEAKVISLRELGALVRKRFLALSIRPHFSQSAKFSFQQSFLEREKVDTEARSREGK
jgi:hypothetical protein